MFVQQLQEVGMPWVMAKLSICMENRKLKKQLGADQKVGLLQGQKKVSFL